MPTFGCFFFVHAEVVLGVHFMTCRGETYAECLCTYT